MTRARDVANSTTALSVDGTVKLDGNYPVGTGNVALGDAAMERLHSAGITTQQLEQVAGTLLTQVRKMLSLDHIQRMQYTTGSSNTALGQYCV